MTFERVNPSFKVFSNFFFSEHTATYSYFLKCTVYVVLEVYIDIIMFG